ncbi:MAG: NADPH-dependent F420 reductase [Planctomycetota bacterium]
MRIAVLGTGSVGGTLGCRWAAAGHEVFFGAEDPASDEAAEVVKRAGSSVKVGICAEAMAASNAALLAIPWAATREVLQQAGNLDGKILIDCINPTAPGLAGLELGFDTSAAERIAGWAPKAHVVKAFNALSAATMENGQFGDQQASMFYCGDHEEAKAVVKELSDQLGFHCVDCGPLKLARQLEPLGMLYIHLAVFQGWGGDCAFKLLKR